MKKENKNIGFYGEHLACTYLKQKKHTILSKNFRTKRGEIDIISKINNIVVFTEVKSRYSKNFGFPRESISYTKKNNIKFIATYFIYLNKIKNMNYRFDVIEVTLNYYNNDYKINHIKNAFQ